jgi:hypothetical protein
LEFGQQDTPGFVHSADTWLCKRSLGGTIRR